MQIWVYVSPQKKVLNMEYTRIAIVLKYALSPAGPIFLVIWVNTIQIIRE